MKNTGIPTNRRSSFNSCMVTNTGIVSNGYITFNNAVRAYSYIVT